MTIRHFAATRATTPMASCRGDIRSMKRTNSLRFHAVAATTGVVIGLAFGVSLAFAGNGTSKPALYTKAQSRDGSKLYRDNCASCHGSNLQGDIGPALVGKHFEQMASAQNLTVNSLLEVTSQSMPKTNPGGLKASQYDSIIAFILHKNGYPAGKTKLTKTEPGLKSVKLAK